MSPESSSSSIGAVREAVQPSLLDRLWDDLPSLAFEIDGLRGKLIAELDEGLIDRCVADGERAIRTEHDISEDQQRDLSILAALMARQRTLEASGIVVTPEVLREAVRRDIEVLFNSERLDAKPLITDEERNAFGDCAVDLSDFPNVRRSVLNFGMPSFAGRSVADFDLDQLSAEVRDVLTVFEPRLRRESVEVIAQKAKDAGLEVEISGILQMSPFPERLRLKTSIDLDSGSANTALEH